MLATSGSMFHFWSEASQASCGGSRASRSAQDLRKAGGKEPIDPIVKEERGRVMNRRGRGKRVVYQNIKPSPTTSQSILDSRQKHVIASNPEDRSIRHIGSKRLEIRMHYIISATYISIKSQKNSKDKLFFCIKISLYAIHCITVTESTSIYL